jgi:hypothetical protein
VQEVVEAGFFLRAAGGGSLGAPICGFLPHKGGTLI